MFQTLYARLATVLVTLFLAIGLLYILISSSITESYLQEITQHFNRDLAQRIVADRNLVVEGQLDPQALKSTFNAYMDINPSIEIYLLDPQGVILAFSADPGKVKRQRVDLRPIRAFLQGERFPLLGDDPRSHDRQKAFSVTTLPKGKMQAGYLYVVLRGEQYDSAEQAVGVNYILQQSVWAVVGTLGFGLMAGLLVFHFLTRRLQRLTAIIEDFQQSGFSQHKSYTSVTQQVVDEIDQLGLAFDQMAERIITQWGELKDQDRLRRELVAQVSHDLRTPLAALHGYLETLKMKKTVLNEFDREEYLTIALRQSSHLKQLVEGLFELAQLEARDSRPNLENFSIAELMQDVMQKFRLRADGDNVDLRMSVPSNPPHVIADLAMTERVLDNLISNAIDHTPDQGVVKLELTVVAKSAVVSIEDSGAGIAQEDLPHIFDPFYRSERSTMNDRHAGLGLAIVKRIIDLQSGTLSVENIPDSGARFSFTLPLLMSS